MLDNAKTWFFDLFFPVVHYRTALHVSYDAFKNNIFLKKLNNYVFSRCYIEYPIYVLCYEIDCCRFMFSISANNSITETTVGFCADTRKKLYAAFAYDFSTKQTNNFCRLSDIELPDIAIAEMKNRILHREDNEVLRLGSFILLKPKESLEEVLIEKDLMC